MSKITKIEHITLPIIIRNVQRASLSLKTEKRESNLYCIGSPE